MNRCVLLALPILCQLGLLGGAKKVYHCLRKGFYGLQATLLTVAFIDRDVSYIQQFGRQLKTLPTIYLSFYRDQF